MNRISLSKSGFFIPPKMLLITAGFTELYILWALKLCSPAFEIVEKYKEHPYCEIHNKLLPVKSNQKMNAYLKEIATICEINKPLTMHIARHTFATTVTLSNGVPIETVSKLLGHTKLQTTQIYAQVLENKVSHDMNVLKEKMFTPKEQRYNEAK